MAEGYYWIKHNGLVQIAYYIDGLCEDLETGKSHRGIWFLTHGEDLSHDDETEIISGPIPQPE